MNRRVLLDVDVILDFILKRKRFVYAEEVFRLIFDRQIDAFLPSTILPILSQLLEHKTRKRSNLKIDSRSTLKTVLSYIHVFTVTGQDVISALVEGGNFEDHLMIESAMRIDSDIIVLTYDDQYSKLTQSMTPKKFIKKFSGQIATTPLSVPLLDLSREYHLMMEEIDDALLSVVASSQFIMGPKVTEFEDECAKYIDSKYAIGVSSGTEALVLALRSLAIQRKGTEFFDATDLVITTPFTFTATGDSILRSGATPLFVDTEPDGFNLNIQNLHRLIDSRKIDPTQVVGILPVHLFGHACPADDILNLADKYNWFVLEDVAQAFGAKWREKRLGSIGTISAFSFFPTKNLGGFGDGGLITTDDGELNQLCRMLLRHGGRDKYNVDHIGYNARLDSLQAAILLVRLKYLDQFNEKRRKIARVYNQKFSGHSMIQTPTFSDESYDVFHQYTIRLAGGLRNTVREELERSGVSSAIYYPIPLHKMKVFQGKSHTVEALLNAQRLCEEVLSLPIEPLMNEIELQHVTSTVLQIFQN